MFMPVSALTTAAPPSSSIDVTRMLVRMQKKKKVRCAALPQRASVGGHSTMRGFQAVTGDVSWPLGASLGTYCVQPKGALDSELSVWCSVRGLTDDLEDGVSGGRFPLDLQPKQSRREAATDAQTFGYLGSAGAHENEHASCQQASTNVCGRKQGGEQAGGHLNGKDAKQQDLDGCA